MENQQGIILLGSTGSIGTQALDVISRYPQRFRVEALSAGSNVELLSRQAILFRPAAVVIGNKDHYKKLKENLSGTGIKISAGIDEMEDLVSRPGAETVIAAVVGYGGLRPVVSAVRAGKRVALANKETLVVAGKIISSLAKESGSALIPVDSEHSAIFQCLSGEEPGSVEKITLTASGGPFLNFPLDKLKEVRPEDALRHPNWSMGAKITIDSASMMNKGLEVIEARWLFNIDASRIKVIIHPQSIIHSMVHFRDGSVKAQMGVPDMRIPILYALGYPERLESDLPRLDFASCSTFTFFNPDLGRFRNLALAYKAIVKGGNMPCILNAANEVAVRAFLNGSTGFMDMPDIVEHTMADTGFIAEPGLEDLENSDREARINADVFINKHYTRT